MTTTVPRDAGSRAGTADRRRRDRSAPAATTAISVVCCAVPVLVLAVMGWQQRWIADDGWINLRVVQQFAAGNGLVYNAGERVEVTTSTVWLWLLLIGHQLTGGTADGTVSVVLGVTLTVVGAIAATLGSARLWRTLRPGAAVVLPLGILAFAVLPPVWDFATSGLETGLIFAWIGGCLWASAAGLDARAGRGRGRTSGGGWHRVGAVATPVLIGLGPLIRPDLALVAGCFGLALLIRIGWRPAALLRTVGLAALVPLLWEVFRAGYYATLVPNTALAKTAGTAAWSAGLIYLDDYAGRYVLVVPLLAAALVTVRLVTLAPARHRLATAATVLAAPIGGLLHGAYVVYVGGDFMHARMLLPATLALLAPAATVALGRHHERWLVAPLAVVVVWSVVVGTTVRLPYTDELDPVTKLANERGYWTENGQNRLITRADVEAHPQGEIGVELRDAEAAGVRNVQVGRDPREPVPWITLAARRGNLGLLGYAAGPEVFILDSFALDDPVGSRLTWAPDPPPDARAGHTSRPVDWQIAAYSLPGPTDVPQVLEARAALQCGEIAELRQAVTGPITPQRFWDNLLASPRLTMLEIPVDPARARAEFCG